MTDAEFRTILVEVGSTPSGFAQALGVAARVGQRWARGNAPIPPAIASIARIMRAVSLGEPYAAIAAVMRREAEEMDRAAALRTSPAAEAPTD